MNTRHIIATTLIALTATTILTACKDPGYTPAVTVKSRTNTAGIYKLHLSDGRSVRVTAKEYKRCTKHRVYPICKTLGDTPAKITVTGVEYVGGPAAKGEYELWLSNGTTTRVRDWVAERCPVGSQFPHCQY